MRMTNAGLATTTLKAGLAAGLLGLTSCSGAFTVYALSLGGSLALSVEPSGTFGFESCPDTIVIEDADGKPVWEHTPVRDAGDSCENSFPIAVGNDVALTPGARYMIDGRSPGVHYWGEFVATADGRYVNYLRDEPVDVPGNVHR